MVKSFGYSGDYNILVMELLGKSLEDLLGLQKTRKFSLKTVCIIAVQILTILEQVHSKHIIHRDIKPDNFVMGINGNENNLYLLDFGLARKYRSSTTGNHYQMKNRKKLTGTARYASINALKGYEQSRRDDLEAVGYVLMYFLRGSLPWQGLPVKTKEDRYRKIMEKKQATSSEELCEGFPPQFVEFLNYTKKLTYEEDPDFIYLKSLFHTVMTKFSYEFDDVYDWSEKKFPPIKNVNANQGIAEKDDKGNKINNQIKPENVETVICQENRPKNILINSNSLNVNKEIYPQETLPQNIVKDQVYNSINNVKPSEFPPVYIDTIRNMTTTVEMKPDQALEPMQKQTNVKVEVVQKSLSKKNSAEDGNCMKKNKKDKGCCIL